MNKTHIKWLGLIVVVIAVGIGAYSWLHREKQPVADVMGTEKERVKVSVVSISETRSWVAQGDTCIPACAKNSGCAPKAFGVKNFGGTGVSPVDNDNIRKQDARATLILVDDGGCGEGADCGCGLLCGMAVFGGDLFD